MAVQQTQRVYLGEVGDFFSLTFPEWEQLCRNAIAGIEYDLTSYKRLNERPLWLAKHKGEMSYYRTRKDRFYYELKGWTAEDFQEALDELTEILRNAKPKRRRHHGVDSGNERAFGVGGQPLS